MRAADFLLEPEAGFDFEGEFIPPVLDEDLLKTLRTGPLTALLTCRRPSGFSTWFTTS
ncbi:hypothetical protein PV458_28105 [Streptomyces sp. MN03-5084-2B]|nr:hypothetical protein [Streptomyces sp. MN03-5084-2B]